MTVNQKILETLTEPKSATQIATEIGLKKTTVKIALLAMFKKNKVTREKVLRAETEKGPKSEYKYAPVSP
jgi:predicted transcriptional regulator